MVDVQTLSIVLTGIGIIGAIVYYTLTLRSANRTRQAQLFMQIYSKWNGMEFSRQFEIVMNMEWTDFDDFNRKYGSDIEYATAVRMVSRFFEGIGLYVKRGLIDVTMVDDLMSGATMRFWEKYRSIMVEARTQWNWPQMLEWTEYLYNEIMPIVEEQHPELKEKELVYV
jgi:hypothetical protein